MTKIAQAEAFAKLKHGDQKYGVHPYHYHLADVAFRVSKVTDDEDMISAAWLHDVLEDTDTTKEEITELFGERVAELVWALTGVGANRKERLASAKAKIKVTPGSDILKCADRLSNVAASLEEVKMDLFKMYYGEHPSLCEVLPTINHPLRRELEATFLRGMTE